MDGQMHQVEAYLGDMGRKCNTRLLEKKRTNLRVWEREIGTAGASTPGNSLARGQTYKYLGR